jgi:hypothetical protein
MKEIQDSSKVYELWDKDMQRTCLCDSGYTGIACNQRTCPVGDDPLTTHDYYQEREVQYLTVFADTPFAGEIALIYTAPDGEKYTTDRFDTAGTLGDAAQTALGDAAQTALRALPNNVLSAVEVKAGACEMLRGGFFKLTFANAGTAAQAVTIGDATNPHQHMHAPKNVATPTASGSRYIRHLNQVYDLSDGGKLVFGYRAEGTDGDLDDQQISIVSHAHCVRYEVTFTGRSGNVAPLIVDTTAVTVPTPGASNRGAAGSVVAVDRESSSIGYVEATFDVTGITGNHHQGLGLHSTGTFVHFTCDGQSFGTGEIISASGTHLKIAERSGLEVYFGGAGADHTCTSTSGIEVFPMTRHAFYPGSGVGSANGIRQLALAQYSVQVKDGNDATPCNLAGTAYNAAGCASWIIRCDFTGSNQGVDDTDDGGAIRLVSDESKLTCAGATIYGPDGTAIDMDTHIHYNSRVNVYCNGVLHGTFTVKSSTATELVFNEIVHDCNGDYVNNPDGVSTANRNTDIIITLADQEIKTDVDLKPYESFINGKTLKLTVNSVTELCKVQSILIGVSGQSVANRIICSNTFTEASGTHTVASKVISLEGVTGSEASTCSDRGLCNFETGMCDCFTGYTGIACESQNALHI